MVCQHGQGKLGQYGHFADKGRGQNFVRTCFMDVAPNNNNNNNNNNTELLHLSV